MAAQQNNLPVLYSYCNSFFVRDVHGEFVPRIACNFVWKSRGLCLETGDPVYDVVFGFVIVLYTHTDALSMFFFGVIVIALQCACGWVM